MLGETDAKNGAFFSDFDTFLYRFPFQRDPDRDVRSEVILWYVAENEASASQRFRFMFLSKSSADLQDEAIHVKWSPTKKHVVYM